MSAVQSQRQPVNADEVRVDSRHGVLRADALARAIKTEFDRDRRRGACGAFSADRGQSLGPA
jgi:hypothetical protein